MSMTASGDKNHQPLCFPSVPTARALWFLAALVAVAIYVVPLVCRFSLLDPDEGLHAAIAQEMVERGDYVSPRLFGKPFFDKPILYFWLQAGSLRLFGMNEAAVRLPGLACALAGALTTALLARRLFGVGLATPLSALIYLSMAAPLALAQAAVHDVALVPWTNLALLCLWNADDETGRRRTWLWYLAGGLCLGLAILTKGLIGVALVGLAFGGYLLAGRRLRWPAVVGAAVACGLAGLLAAPWYWSMHVLHPGYLHYYFVERHMQGFTTATQRHGGRPWWYYIPVLCGGALPWTVYLPTVALCWIRGGLHLGRLTSNRPWLFLGIWLAGDVLFLSAASSKLWTYCLPLFPALALVIAGVWATYMSSTPLEEPRWFRRAISAMCLIGPCALPLSMKVAAHQFALEFSSVAWIAAAIIGLSWLASNVLWYRRRYLHALVALEGSLVLHFLFVLVLVMPLVAENVSARALAERLNQLERVPERVLIVDERIGSLIFYLRADLRAGLAPDQILSVPHEQLGTDPALTPGALTVVAARVLQRLPADSPLHTSPFERVGRFRLYDAVGAADAK